VSILHSRIVRHGGQGGTVTLHPYGTPATPMVMPHWEVDWNHGTGVYRDLSPALPATGDVNAVPLASVAPGTWGAVHPAGRP
jgi:hypothetical protein